MATTLIADDEDDMLLLLRLVLRVADIEIDVVGEAHNGAEALECFAGITDPKIPDVVVLDNRMPRLTGLEAAEQILEQRPGQQIILYSAHLNDDVREKAKTLGITACMEKEEIEDLPDVIRRCIGAV